MEEKKGRLVINLNIGDHVIVGDIKIFYIDLLDNDQIVVDVTGEDELHKMRHLLFVDEFIDLENDSRVKYIRRGTKLVPKSTQLVFLIEAPKSVRIDRYHVRTEGNK